MAKKSATAIDLNTLDLPGVLKVFRDVAQTGETRVIVQDDREIVRVVPPDAPRSARRRRPLRPSLRELRARAYAAIHSIGSANDEVSDEDVMADVNEALAEVRQEQRHRNG